MHIEQIQSLGRQSLRIEDGEYVNGQNDFRELMLLHNRIEGILKFEIINENGKKIYEYSISGMESLKSFCEHHKIGIKELRNIFGKLLQSFCHGHEFMLLEDDYVVTPDTVYTDGKERTEAAYYSGYGKKLREQLRIIAEFMMDYVDYHDDDAVLLVYSIYMKTKDESCTLDDLAALLGASGDTSLNMEKSVSLDGEELRNEVDPEVDRSERSLICIRETGEPQVSFDAGKEAARMAEHAAFKEIIPDKTQESRRIADLIRSAPGRIKFMSLLIPFCAILIAVILAGLGVLTNITTGRPDTIKCFFVLLAGGTIVLSLEKRMWGKFSTAVEESFRTAREREDEATLLLCDDGMARYPFSLVSDEYPTICAGKFPFFVGKDGKTSDYVLNRAGVSRYHLKIDRDGEIFTIADMASTNGTYLNGTRLEPYKAERVKRGDEVRIGACIFYCN